MYQGKQILRRLDSNKHRFSGRQRLTTIKNRLQSVLRPFGVKILISQEAGFEPGDFCVSGYFDITKKRQNIELILHYHEQYNFFIWLENSWEQFRFLIAQVLQHELIHRSQYQYRDDATRKIALYYDIKGTVKSDKEYMDYLSELDEIDAYAHDIAMEICHYYPKKNPLDVLRTINHKQYLHSYKVYKRTFQGVEDWKDVHNRLLKKVYEWIPYITI